MSVDSLASLRDALAATSEPGERRARLRAIEDPDAILAAWVPLIVRAARSEPARARREARAACVLATRCQHPERRRLAWRARGGVHLLAGMPRPALRALERARRGADLSARVQSAASYAQVLGELGRFREAEEALEEARPVVEENNESARRTLFELTAITLLERAERYPEALARLERLDAELAANGGDSSALPFVRANLANVLTQLSEYDRADALYAWLEARHAEQGERHSLLQTSYNRAYVAALRGRYRRALLDLEALETRARELGDDRHVAHCMLDRAEIQLRLGSPQEAAASAEAAAEILDRLGHERDAARASSFRGVALLARGETAAASELLRDACERLARLHSPVWAALGEHQLARALHREGLEEAAARHARHAAQALYRLGLVERGGQAELLEASLERERGQFGRARARLLGLEARLGDLYAPWLRCDLQYALALCCERLGDLDAARRHIGEALDLLDRHRLGVPPDETMSAFLDQRADMAECAVRLFVPLGDEGAVRLFDAIEGAKSRALLDMLRAGRAGVPIGLLDPEVDVDAIEREIDGLGRLRWSDGGFRAEAEAARRAAALASRQRRLNASLEALEQAEADGTCWHRRPIGLDEARRALDDDTTVLTMHVGRDALVLGLLDANGFRTTTHSFTEWHARRLVRRLGFHLDRPAVVFEAYGDGDPSLVSRAEGVLVEGWEALIAPVADAVTTPRLVIVPHGPLHAVPFHALLPAVGAEPLLSRFAVTTAPSVSVYVHARSRTRSSGVGTAAFGVPDPDAPFVGDEALAVATVWPDAELRLREEATRARFLDALRERAIVHLASHGVFDDEAPLRAGVRLGDGWLRTADLYCVEVRADLVVLSGCVTGRTAIRAADEPMGLVRGFLTAGARALVNTLWHVADRPAATAMERFHLALARGLRPVAALERAISETRSLHPHPAHWAPFAIVGHAI